MFVAFTKRLFVKIDKANVRGWRATDDVMKGEESKSISNIIQLTNVLLVIEVSSINRYERDKISIGRCMYFSIFESTVSSKKCDICVSFRDQFYLDDD